MNVSICLSSVPIQCFEWDTLSFLTNQTITRVSTKCILDLLLYECNINTNQNILLLTDTKSSIVVKIKDNKVIKRSFLTYDDDLNVGEYACSLKETKLKYTKTDFKIKYSNTLKEEENIKKYLINSVQSTLDESKLKYIYYLLFDNLTNYSKESIIKNIKSSNDMSLSKLYKFFKQS